MVTRNYVVEGDILARWGAWHRRYKVVGMRKVEGMWICQVKFLGNFYGDGRVEPAQRSRVRDIPTYAGGDRCPIPPAYAVYEESADGKKTQQS